MNLRAFVVLAILSFCSSGANGETSGKRPASLTQSELRLPADLSKHRSKLISEGLKLSSNYGWLKYEFGSADPKNGGFDCSGATYYLLRRVGLKPPRTSSDQYLWVKKESTFHSVQKKVKDLEGDAFKDLKPGDLLFWTGTYHPTDGREIRVTHVAIYAGHDQEGRPIMLNASNGRSYKGQRQTGFGVFDFKLPSAKSKSTFLGYGTPPGLE